MLSVSLFKSSFCQSDVVLGGGLISCHSCYLCIVDQAGGLAFIVERAILLRSAVTWFVVVVVGVVI